MKSSDIELSTTYRQFAFERISREIESCNDIVILKEALRSYVKLFFKQQETISNIDDFEINIGGDIPPEFDDPLM
jgi:hypothetical protein